MAGGGVVLTRASALNVVRCGHCRRRCLCKCGVHPALQLMACCPLAPPPTQADYEGRLTWCEPAGRRSSAAAVAATPPSGAARQNAPPSPRFFTPPLPRPALVAGT